MPRPDKRGRLVARFAAQPLDHLPQRHVPAALDGLRGDNQEGFWRQSGWMMSGRAGGWA